jgi:hypothetical protein
VTTPDDVLDPPADVSDPTDTAQPPTDTPTPPPDAASPDADAEDPGPVCDVLGEECTPSTVQCSDARTRVFCDRCGFIINTSTCAIEERCDDSAPSAVCVPCGPGECDIPPECLPNSRTCQDFRTAQVCGPDGTVTATNPCPAGRRCFDGNCGPDGQPTASPCTKNIDPTTGCRGTLCVCGDDWTTANTDAGCVGSLGSGYCSTAGCVQNGCDPASEVCADFSVNGSWAGNDFCITREGCTRLGSSCGSAGMACQELPTRSGPSARIEWSLACWTTGSRAIGQTCSNDRECSGGLCLTRSRGGVPVSYCAAPCGAEAGCPSNARCVADPGGASRFLCLANASAADCPRLDTEPLNIRPTRELQRFGGGTARVCYFAF